MSSESDDVSFNKPKIVTKHHTDGDLNIAKPYGFSLEPRKASKQNDKRMFVLVVLYRLG